MRLPLLVGRWEKGTGRCSPLQTNFCGDKLNSMLVLMSAFPFKYQEGETRFCNYHEQRMPKLSDVKCLNTGTGYTRTSYLVRSVFYRMHVFYCTAGHKHLARFYMRSTSKCVDALKESRAGFRFLFLLTSDLHAFGRKSEGKCKAQYLKGQKVNIPAVWWRYNHTATTVLLPFYTTKGCLKHESARFQRTVW